MDRCEWIAWTRTQTLFEESILLCGLIHGLAQSLTQPVWCDYFWAIASETRPVRLFSPQAHETPCLCLTYESSSWGIDQTKMHSVNTQKWKYFKLLLLVRGPKNWNSTSMEKKPDLFAHSYCQSCWSTTCWLYSIGASFSDWYSRRGDPPRPWLAHSFLSWCLLAIWSSEQSLSRDNWCASNQSWSNSWKASLSDSRTESLISWGPWSCDVESFGL